MINRILERLEEESDFFGGKPMGSLQKAYYCEGVKKAKEIVQEEADKGGWIPTEWELFPRMGQMVIASVDTTDAKHEIIITKYQNQDYWHNGTITAWMPLPPVYQKGE